MNMSVDRIVDFHGRLHVVQYTMNTGVEPFRHDTYVVDYEAPRLKFTYQLGMRYVLTLDNEVYDVNKNRIVEFRIRDRKLHLSKLEFINLSLFLLTTDNELVVLKDNGIVELIDNGVSDFGPSLDTENIFYIKDGEVTICFLRRGEWRAKSTDIRLNDYEVKNGVILSGDTATAINDNVKGELPLSSNYEGEYKLIDCIIGNFGGYSHNLVLLEEVNGELIIRIGNHNLDRSIYLNNDIVNLMHQNSNWIKLVLIGRSVGIINKSGMVCILTMNGLNGTEIDHSVFKSRTKGKNARKL
jgi:hypothetical protein